MGEWVNVPCPECTDRKEMEMPERERAEQWLSENWKGDFWDEDVRSLMQFMREERAWGKEKR